MSSHALALVYIFSFLFQLGCSLGYPKDKRPWNDARVAGAFAGLIGTVAVAWLVVRAL